MRKRSCSFTTISRAGMRAAIWDKSAKASSTKCESVIEYGTDTERRKGSVTVKAEDRPSGLAGDSASVITFLFRLQPGLVEWRVLVAAARSGAALVSRLSHIFMDTQLLIIAFLRIRTLDKLFEATIALVNFRICN